MGIDVNLIIGNYEEDYICGVCTDLLEDPIALKRCEHLFCRACTDGIIRTGKVQCPECRTDFSQFSDVIRPVRLIRKFMSRIRVSVAKKYFSIFFRKKNNIIFFSKFY